MSSIPMLWLYSRFTIFRGCFGLLTDTVLTLAGVGSGVYAYLVRCDGVDSIDTLYGEGLISHLPKVFAAVSLGPSWLFGIFS